MKYIRYRRKSSEQEERQALSIESQKIELERKFPDLEIMADFEESKSAFTPDQRPKFKLMIEMIKSGKADGIITWHPDRLSRNEVEAAQITYLTRKGIIKDLKFCSYYFDNSPEGIMMLQSALSHSQYSSSKLSVDVKRGLGTKADKGWLPSGAKPGYMNDKFAEKGNKTIQKDPIRFPLIRKAWDLMLTGAYTPPQILRKLNDEWGYRTPKHRKIGGKPMSRSMIYKVFTDTFYYGEFEYPLGSGIFHEGKHEPMISREEFERVQQLLGRKGRPRPKTKSFTYTGLFTCGECGASITAEEKFQIICPICKTKFASQNKVCCPNCKTPIEKMVKPTLLHYIYYHCTKRKKKKCFQKSVKVDDLERQVDTILSSIQISERFKNWAVKYINELNDNEVKDRNTILESLQEAYNDCIKRIDNLLKFKISPQNSDGSLLSDEEFKNQKETLIAEKKTISEKLNITDERINKWTERAEKAFNLACYARYWFFNGDPETRKEILIDIGSNLVINNKFVLVDLEKPIKYIKEAKDEVPEISPMFEPEKSGYTTAQLEAYYSQNPILLRR